MTKIEPVPVGLSLMPGEDFWQAAQPLFDANEVEIVEWSFDIGWGRTLPNWLLSILNDFSDRGRLLGHGVSYSALDASNTGRQDQWLERLAAEVNQFHYQHISEHFGFMGGGNFHLAAPLPVPRTPASVAVGQARLMQLASVAQVPVGVLRIALARIAGRNWSIVARRRPRTSSSIPPEKGRRVWKVKRATNCGSAAGGFEFLIEDSFDSFRILCLLVGERCDVKHRQQDCHHDDCDQATHHDGNGRLQERHDIS